MTLKRSTSWIASPPLSATILGTQACSSCSSTAECAQGTQPHVQGLLGVWGHWVLVPGAHRNMLATLIYCVSTPQVPWSPVFLWGGRFPVLRDRVCDSQTTGEGSQQCSRDKGRPREGETGRKFHKEPRIQSVIPKMWTAIRIRRVEAIWINPTLELWRMDAWSDGRWSCFLIFWVGCSTSLLPWESVHTLFYTCLLLLSVAACSIM